MSPMVLFFGDPNADGFRLPLPGVEAFPRLGTLSGVGCS